MAHITVNELSEITAMVEYLKTESSKVLAVEEMAGHRHVHVLIGEPDSLSSKEREALKKRVKRRFPAQEGTRMSVTAHTGKASKNGTGPFYVMKGYRELEKHFKYEGEPVVLEAHGYTTEELAELRRKALSWLVDNAKKGPTGRSVIQLSVDHCVDDTRQGADWYDIADRLEKWVWDYHVEACLPMPVGAKATGIVLTAMGRLSVETGRKLPDRWRPAMYPRQTKDERESERLHSDD